MADSKSETVLKALHTALAAAAPSGALVERNTALPTRLPTAGALIARDGTPGEPEVLLSPLAYFYQHRAEIDVVVAGKTAATRDARFDVLKQAITAAIAPDRTLGGECDWSEAQAPQTEEIPVEGGAPLKAGVVGVVLHYGTDDPLT